MRGFRFDFSETEIGKVFAIEKKKLGVHLASLMANIHWLLVKILLRLLWAYHEFPVSYRICEIVKPYKEFFVAFTFHGGWRCCTFLYNLYKFVIALMISSSISTKSKLYGHLSGVEI